MKLYRFTLVSLITIILCSGCATTAQKYDVVFAGGRVIDPETGLDAIRNVGISGDTIAAVSKQPLEGKRVVDVTGLIVSPSFIDLHSHSVVNLPANRLQACDGVTTALELDSGVLPVDAWYEAIANDPETITDRATIDAPALTSKGVEYLVVSGTLVIDGGETDLAVLPGKAIRGKVSR